MAAFTVINALPILPSVDQGLINPTISALLVERQLGMFLKGNLTTYIKSKKRYKLDVFSGRESFLWKSSHKGTDMS